MNRPAWLVRIVIVTVSGLYTLALFLSGATLLPGINQTFAALPVVGSLLLLLWDYVIWKLKFVQRITKRPYIAGLWQATYQPTAESHIPGGGNRGPILGYLVIRQSYWSLSVRSFTAESRSDSRAVFWELHPGSDFETPTFVYENLPKESESHRSTRHLGTNRFDPASASPSEIEGSYFTDRYTKGDIRVELIDRSSGYGSFKAANEAAEKPR